MNSQPSKPRRQMPMKNKITKSTSESGLDRAIINSLPIGIILANSEGTITFANETTTMIFHRDCPVGQPIELLAGTLRLEHPEGRPIDNEELPLVQAVRYGRSTMPKQVLVTRPDGEKRLTLWKAISMEGGDIQNGSVLGTIEDITEHQESSLLNGEFFSVVVHELRTPLTAIKGHSQLLIRRPDYMLKQEAMGESLATIVDQADRLAGMINKLLDVSRAQMGTMELNRQRFDLIGLVTTTIDDMQHQTERHRLLCTTEEQQLQGTWDHSYLQQVLVNLMENAIKYSPEGGDITVSIRSGGDRALVSVKDQGMGMGQEALSKLFHSFYRSPQARGLGARGLGVGLYITNQIVTAHNGHIWAESEPGCGSTFTFSLPLE